MAHNIANVNGKDAMAYVGKQPWHKLGTYLGEQLTAADLRRLLGQAAPAGELAGALVQVRRS